MFQGRTNLSRALRSYLLAGAPRLRLKSVTSLPGSDPFMSLGPCYPVRCHTDENKLPAVSPHPQQLSLPIFLIESHSPCSASLAQPPLRSLPPPARARAAPSLSTRAPISPFVGLSPGCPRCSHVQSLETQPPRVARPLALYFGDPEHSALSWAGRGACSIVSSMIDSG